MDANIKKMIILHNYQNPTNRGLCNDCKYCSINTNSESCIDQIELQIKFEKDIIKDIRFDGEACAICISSTSIMINTLIGKKRDEALYIIDNYKKMINEENFDSSVLDEALVYSDISKEPNRKNCALLTWNGIEKLIKGGERCE